MKAYRIKSNKTIEPFGDHPLDCLIDNRSLADTQKEILLKLGIELQPEPYSGQIDNPDEHIFFEDSLFFSPELMQQFIKESRKLKRSTICAIKPGLFTLRSILSTQDIKKFPDRVEYSLQYMPAKELRGKPEPLVIDPDQFSEVTPLPEHVTDSKEFRIPVTDSIIIQIDHWANLWVANIFVLFSELARLRKASPLKLLILALRARSINKWKILNKTNKIGRNCDIHPTAYIEGSTIGDNVTIGAGSVIRMSKIGTGTSIGSNSTIEFSILGEGCAIDSMAGAFSSVLYPGTVSSSKFLFTSLCGKNTFLADGVIVSDYRFDGKNISVMKNGNPVDTGSLALGICLGHDVYLGGGCISEPGRSIPNGLRITPEKARTIGKCGIKGDIPGYQHVKKIAKHDIKI
jgi:acetyltransferase-like isoleucine patch superfamily enzyme